MMLPLFLEKIINGSLDTMIEHQLVDSMECFFQRPSTNCVNDYRIRFNISVQRGFCDYDKPSFPPDIRKPTAINAVRGRS